MKEEKLTANEAYKLAVQNELNQLDVIMAQIHKMATLSHTSLMFYNPIDEPVRKKLIELGYFVSETIVDRDGIFTHINWLPKALE